LGAPLDKIFATPFGVDTQFFRLSTSDARGQDPLKLICTRNFDSIYDVKTLIRALALVCSAGRRLSVDIVGDGPLRQPLLDLVHELGLESRIKFHGYVEHKILASLLAGADIFVTPALSDGNNVSLNEAMASGCFPIASDIPANAQWIKNGQNGYLYPAGDVEQLARAIEMAMDNKVMRQSARAENREIAETRVDWRICVKQMEDIYPRLAASFYKEAQRGSAYFATRDALDPLKPNPFVSEQEMVAFLRSKGWLVAPNKEGQCFILLSSSSYPSPAEEKEVRK
jgi:glycosyltransferase involved in cell wall biosynthesis